MTYDPNETRELEADREGRGIPSPKITVRQVELLGVDTLVTGATIEVEDLELRGKVVRLQIRQKAGSAANYDWEVRAKDPGVTPDAFDVVADGSAVVASDPVDENVDKVYENQDTPTMRRSLWITIVPDNVGTPNDYDIRVTVEQRI